MRSEVVEDYAWNILKKQLQKFKISNTALYNIIDNVKEQLNSLISNWNDIEFRDAILVLGSEEGTFYEPKNEQIANMVVVTIRNSLLEGVSSDSYVDYGSSVYLEDSKIKEITGAAIEYFSKINLEEEATKIKLDYDFYKEVSKKYPVAMKGLIELSKCSIDNREHSYEPLDTSKYELEELNERSGDKASLSNVESGISSSFNNSLLILLHAIKEKELDAMVVDCFKMATRNFEKMLKILEFILTHDGMFITCNYLISKDYVSRRKDLLKASHTTAEFLEKVKKLEEVSEKYNKYLVEYKERIIENR